MSGVSGRPRAGLGLRLQLAGWLARRGQQVGASEAGSAQLLLGGPDALSPAQGLRSLSNPGNKATASAWAVDGSPLSMLALHSGFFSGLVSAFGSPVHGLMYGRWLKETFIALAP